MPNSNLRRMMMAVQRPSILPPGYRAVSYLHSDGRQIIKFPYSGHVEALEVLVQFDAPPTKRQAMGDYQGNARCYFNIVKGPSGFVYSLAPTPDTTVQPAANSFDLVKLQVDSIKQISDLYVNHVLIRQGSPRSGASLTFSIFNIHPQYDTGCICKIQGAKVYTGDDGKLAMDLHPCVRKSDNKPGMYDILNQKFYINEGTGEFTWN